MDRGSCLPMDPPAAELDHLCPGRGLGRVWLLLGHAAGVCQFTPFRQMQ